MGLFNMFSSITKSPSGKWGFKQENGNYYILKTESGGYVKVRTPRENEICTSFKSVAEKLLQELEMYGYDNCPETSVLSWQIENLDIYKNIGKLQLFNALRYTIESGDWSIVDSYNDAEWREYMGMPDGDPSREDDIIHWLKQCSSTQMLAIGHIAEKYDSVNIAYCFASSILKNKETNDDYLYYVASVLSANDSGISIESVYENFKIFKFFYCLDFNPAMEMHARQSLYINYSLDAMEKMRQEELKRQDALETEYGKAVMELVKHPDDLETGYQRIKIIADDGYAEAGILLGQYYVAEGRINEAREYYKKAASNKIAEGMWGYAGTLDHDYVVNEYCIEDREWVRSILNSAEAGCADAMNEAGNIYNRQNNYHLSAYWYGMAELYEHPQAVYGCRGIAKKWMEAGRPEPSHMNEKAKVGGFFLLTDTGDRNERAVAFEAIRSCAKTEKNADCALFMAEVLEQNEKEAEAYSFYEIAAEKGSIQAIRSLADMKFFGNGIAKNQSEAFENYRKAAEKGEKNACFVMGEFMRNAGNEAKAAAWYVKAHVRGFEAAMDRVRQMAGVADKPEEEEIINEADQREMLDIEMDAVEAFAAMYDKMDFSLFEKFLSEDAEWTSSYSNNNYHGIDEIRRYYEEKLPMLKDTKIIDVKVLEFSEGFIDLNGTEVMVNGKEDPNAKIKIAQPAGGKSVVLSQLFHKENGVVLQDALFHLKFDKDEKVCEVSVLNDVFLRKGRYKTVSSKRINDVWGPGIPKYSYNDILRGRELLHYGIETLFSYLEKDGFEIVNANDDPNRYPHIIARKDDVMYGIYVETDSYPNHPEITDDIVSKMKHFEAQTNMKPMYAAVSFGAADADRFNAGLLLKYDAMYCKFTGLEEIR